MKIALRDFCHAWIQFGDTENANCVILEISKSHFSIDNNKFIYVVKRLHPLHEQRTSKFFYNLEIHELAHYFENRDLAQSIRDEYPQAIDKEVATINEAVQELKTTCCGIKEAGIACTAYQRILRHGPDTPDYDWRWEDLKYEVKKLMP